MAFDAKAYRKKYYAEHREEALAASKSWRASNKAKHAAYCKQFKEANKGYYNQYYGGAVRLRRANLAKACPIWLTEEQKTAIKAVYENTPLGLVVDHIVPLKGKNVCGLHVSWNLQYLTREENSRKGNRLVQS